MNINLKTIEDVHNFVSICSKYHDCNIDVKQDRQIINGKSILGIFSLNLLDPLKIIVDSENKNLKIEFYNDIQKWAVDVH